MYCGNCGQKLGEAVKFCGNCGTKVRGHTERVSHQENGNWSKNIKKEISSLPLITLIGDTVKGASGLADLQEKLKNDPDDPLLWLFYYEGFITYKKMNKGMNAARLVYNPVGFAVSKGVASGLNALDDEYEAFDPKKCLSMSLALCMKRIEKKEAVPADLLITGKTLFYMAINEADMEKKNALLKRAVKYLNLAVQAEGKPEHIAEYFFYLSQMYEVSGEEKLQFRALNISRKMGFAPSLELIKGFLKTKGMEEEKINQLKTFDLPVRIQHFSYTFKLEAGDRVQGSLKFAWNEQNKKFKDTTSRLKNLFS